MSKDPEPSVTELLQAIKAGDRDAEAHFMRRVYGELKRLAQAQLRRLPPGKTLQPTALVNEVWMRLAGKDSSDVANSRAFFGVAARAMRDILVENARRKAALKRGRPWRLTDSDSLQFATESPPEELLALDEALDELESLYPRKARIVQLRFFVGLTDEKIATALELSDRTVRRDWIFARAWLQKKLSEDGEQADS